jgi:hypothetical protein
VQRRLIAARDTARQQRLKEIEAVRKTLPQGAFLLPITALGLPDNITEALLPFENVGEIMLRFLIDENRVRRALNDFPPDAFRRLQEALDKLVIPEVEAPPVVETPEVAVEGEAPAVAVAVSPDEAPARVPETVRQLPRRPDEDEELDINKKGKGKKKKSRQLVFDEKTGGMVVKRQRKTGRTGGDWNNWDE